VATDAEKKALSPVKREIYQPPVERGQTSGKKRKESLPADK